jgi:outer membrane beta-barrel protein
MRRYSLRAALIFGVILIGLPVGARAQIREKSWELFPYLGHVAYSHPDFGDTVEVRIDTPSLGQTEAIIIQSSQDDSLSIGLRFGYNWTKQQMVEFSFGGSSTDAFLSHTTLVADTVTGVVQSVKVLSETLSVDLLYGQVNYVYNFSLHRRDKVIAYLTGGLGVASTSVFGLTGQPEIRPILSEFVGEENNFALNYGAGIRFFGSESVAFRLELRQVEFSSSNRIDQDYLEISMGVSLILGGN